MKILISIFAVSAFLNFAQARGGGGGFEIGVHGGMLTTNQKDMDTLKNRANTREGGISTGDLGTAFEFAASAGYRFSGTIYEMLLRPTYMFHTEEGTDNSGAKFEYGVTGFTIFPIFRFFPLESDILKLFFQIGIGFGHANGHIQEDTFDIEFSGNDLGYLVGLGIEICFTDFHCMSLEGNVRQLSFDRVLADKVSGTPGGAPIGISQATVGQEVEMDGRDMFVTMSGFQALLGYVMHF
ncbi:MAG: hypothetical protein SGJ18_13375 [Pseudomonadota bacterium]|nr:hypothetical protein [Pseudomonadota bacterium]